MNKQPLTGSEDTEAFDDWYQDMENDFELIIPGSKVIMRQAEGNPAPITMHSMLSGEDSDLVSKVSRELYSVLAKKTISTARNQIKVT